MNREFVKSLPNIWGVMPHKPVTVESDNQTSFDTLFDNLPANANVTYGMDVNGYCSSFASANRTFAICWGSYAKNWAWALCFNFYGMYFGARKNTTTFTFTKIA